MNTLILGAIAMASSIAALFFLNLAKDARPPLHLVCLAFAVDAITRSRSDWGIGE